MQTQLHFTSIVRTALLLVITAFSGLTLRAANPPASAIDFIKGDFAWMQRFALNEHKPYFVTFLASWSEPCTRMESETFTHPGLGNYVNEHFLAYQVYAEGAKRGDRDLETEFGVIFYPTVIVFDHNGQVLHQFSGLKDAASFQSELESVLEADVPQTNVYTSPQSEANTFVKTSLTAILPQNSFDASASYSRYEGTPAVQASPVGLKIVDEGLRMMNQDETWHTATVVYPEKTWTPQPDPQPVYLSETVPAVAPATFGFALQAGAFSTYDNARTLQLRLKDTWGFATTIWTIHTATGTPVYKVMVGAFSNKVNAQQWRATQSADITADWFVVSLKR